MATPNTPANEELKKAKQPQNMQQCEKCKKDHKATGFCRDCGKLVCDKCIEIHQTWEDYSSHGIIVFPRENPPPQKLLHCPKHPDNALTLFCEPCQELLCDKCTAEQHQGQEHQYDQVTKVFPKHRDEIIEHLQPVRQQLESVNKALRALDARKKDINEQKSAIESQIHTRIKELYQVLEMKGQELVGQLHRISQRKLESLDNQEKEFEVLQTQLTSFLENVESSLSKATAVGVLATKASKLNQIKLRATKFNPDMLHPHETADMLLVEQNAPRLMEACRKFAAITTTQRYATGGVANVVTNVVTVNEPVEVTLQLMDTDEIDSVQSQDVTSDLVCCRNEATVKCSVEKVKKGKFRVRCKPEARGKHQLRLAIKERPAVGSPYTILVRPEIRGLQCPLKIMGDLKNPRCIVTDSKGRIIVSEYGAQCVSIFTAEGEKVRSFGEQGKGKGQFQYPLGVTVDGDDNIYVVDNGNKCVQKFTSEGEYVTSTASNSSNTLQFIDPYGITYNPRNGRLYVCDQRNHRIQILDTNLAILNTVSGERDGKFSYPQGVAFDSDGNMYVASQYHIQVFTPEGQHLREIGTNGSGRGQLQCAEGITIDRDRVYMTDLANHRVSVFTTTGQFLHSFGSEETQPGQIKRPSGIRIDGKGFNLVADCDNCRIQIS